MSYNREKIAYTIGLRIRDFRNEKKLSQEALALASGLHPAYLGRVERGEKCPSIETLYKISKGLNISLSILLDLSAEIKPTSAEAMYRIQKAMAGLTESEAMRIAEIIENIVSFKN